jgi:protein involved in polysaccharide export with SLBB domain
MTSAKRAALRALTISAMIVTRAPAQNAPVPPPAQAPQALQQAAQQQPELADLLRQRIQSSGLTPEQIRSRLAASGYPPNVLDAYLGVPSPGQASSQPGSQELAAIQALGFGTFVARPESLSVDTGLIRMRADSATTPIFGADVFRRSTTQFLPLLAGPVPTDYKLGPGDVLVLILTGDVELAYTLQITREGFVLVPQVGQVFVSNLTLDQLRDVLYSRLSRVYSGVRRGPTSTTRFDITVANVRANQVYVVGEVNQPGAYQISALGTALSALYAAGGVTQRANMRLIDIRRLGRSVATLDLYDYLLHGDTRSDIRLETGDVVFVPVHGTRAEVVGAVVRPAIYELKPGESLLDLLRAAGGFRPNAALNRVSVRRILPAALRTAGAPARTVIDVQLTPEQPTPDPDPPGDPAPPVINGVMLPSFGMNDGDSVVVDSLPEKAGRNFVDIRGSVYQPGRYGLEPGMALSRLVKRAGGFRPATYAGRAHIERLNVADSTRYVLAVELPGDTGVAWKNDPKLQQYDVVTVYGRPEMRDSLYVAIGGMVNAPGRYTWRQGMTLRDVILMAHGPRFGAYLKEAEIARLPVDRSAGQLAQALRVALDSTYLFDRDSTGHYVGPPGLPAPARGAPEVALEPYDNVLILKQPDFELQRRVYVLGEVRFPGTYSLKWKDERLADVIERAGGLTAQAYPAGIRFVRVVGNAGRINIDLTRALDERKSRADIILQQGDSILVPEYQPSVKIAGAVNAPGSVLWQEGQGLDDYVGGAGGYSYLADRGRVSVRYANGEVRTRRRSLLFSSEPRPGPGSEVFGPVKDTTHTTNYVALFGSIVQILASTIAIVVVIRHP